MNIQAKPSISENDFPIGHTITHYGTTYKVAWTKGKTRRYWKKISTIPRGGRPTAFRAAARIVSPLQTQPGMIVSPLPVQQMGMITSPLPRVGTKVAKPSISKNNYPVGQTMTYNGSTYVVALAKKTKGKKRRRYWKKLTAKKAPVRARARARATPRIAKAAKPSISKNNYQVGQTMTYGGLTYVVALAKKTKGKKRRRYWKKLVAAPTQAFQGAAVARVISPVYQAPAVYQAPRVISPVYQAPAVYQAPRVVSPVYQVPAVYQAPRVVPPANTTSPRRLPRMTRADYQYAVQLGLAEPAAQPLGGIGHPENVIRPGDPLYDQALMGNMPPPLATIKNPFRTS